MAWRSLAAQGSSSSLALHTWPYAPEPSGASRIRRTEPKRIGGRVGSAMRSIQYFLEKTPRLLLNFISALYTHRYKTSSYIYDIPQCGDYSRAATIRSTDVAATINFISALPQCGDYSRAATIRSTDVVATIYVSSTAMWRLFEVQTSWLLFISALPQFGDYSRVATIRGAVFIRGNTVYQIRSRGEKKRRKKLPKVGGCGGQAGLYTINEVSPRACF